MAEFRDRTFSGGETVDVDGNRYIKCRFDGVQLRYGGGPHPYFEECEFPDGGWYFTDAALRTIQLLQVINGSPQGPEFIADLFKPGNYITD